MATIRGRIIEIFVTGEGNGARIALERPIQAIPGQYLHASIFGQASILPVSLFPIDDGGEELRVVLPAAPEWLPGQEITLRGPLGNGFTLPSTPSRIGLLALSSGVAACLLPLAQKALMAGCEVALVTDAPLQGVPAAVEVLPLGQLEEVCSWADNLSIAILRDELDKLFLNVVEKVRSDQKRFHDEVLIYTEMPCRGISACGVCSVKTKSGWKFVCKDGPVFQLAELVPE